MQLDLNTKEWLALLIHLERTVQPEDGLEQVRGRLRNVVAQSLRDLDANLADRWLKEQKKKITNLGEDLRRVTEDTGSLRILTADDDEDEPAPERRNYPRKPPRMPKPGRRGKKRRR